MEIHQLELLDVLVKQGSFKKAAEATFVSTSTLTRQVSSMEAELGFPLFIRSAYGISLTEQGEVFYRETRAIVHAYEAAVLSARSTDSLHRLIRIGTYSYIRSAITRTCADLKRRCPWLSFSFASCNAQVCLSRFTGTVNSTAHNRNLYRKVFVFLKHFFYRICKLDERYLRPSAGRT